MSSHTTDTLGLHTWEPLDMFTREEFNKNFNLIDAHAGEALARLAAAQGTADGAAAAAKAAQATANSAQSAANAAQSTANGRLRINYGYYTGTGTGASERGGVGPTHTLNIGFSPQLVIISAAAGNSYGAAISAQDTRSAFPPFFFLPRNINTIRYYNDSVLVFYNLTWGSTSLKFYASPYESNVTLSPIQSLNGTNYYYHWIAFG